MESYERLKKLVEEVADDVAKSGGGNKENSPPLDGAAAAAALVSSQPRRKGSADEEAAIARRKIIKGAPRSVTIDDPTHSVLVSKEAKEVVKDHGPVMRLVETSKNGPFKDWDDQVLLNPLQGIQSYWFRNGIDMEYELT